MDESGVDQAAGTLASSTEFSRYDQVQKADYHLAEAADSADDFDDEFEFTTCDLAQYLEGSEADRDAFSETLGDAMSEIGFAILVGHGVDTTIYDEATAWVEEFFTTQPMEAKLARRAERHGAVSEGYFPVHETSDIHPDLVEGWVFGRRAFDLDGDPDFDPAPFWHDVEFEPKFRRLVEAELPLFDGRPYPASCAALEESILLTMPVTTFHRRSPPRSSARAVVRNRTSTPGVAARRWGSMDSPPAIPTNGADPSAVPAPAARSRAAATVNGSPDRRAWARAGIVSPFLRHSNRMGWAGVS